MLRLVTFGGLSVGRADGAGSGPFAGAAVQRRPLALLAQIAAAGERGVSRTTLVGRLWPDADEERARRVLAQTLYSLRRDLGEPELVIGAEELRLNAAVIEADVVAFGAALREGALERAVEIHVGPFLDGFRLPDAPAFERWAEEERERLAGRRASALEQLARLAHERRAWAEEATWLRLVAAHDPLSADVALRLVRALAESGDRAAALRHVRVHETLVRQELEVDPDPRVAALAEELRREPAPAPGPGGSGLGTGDSAAADAGPGQRRDPGSGSEVGARSGAGDGASRTPPPDRRRSSRARRIAVAAAAALVLTLVSAAAWRMRDLRMRDLRMPGRGGPPVVAVLPFADRGETGEQAYFGDGLADELIGALGAVDGIEVVARTSSFAFRGREKPLPDIARDLRATHVLEGSVRRGDDRLRVTVQLVDARTGYRVWSRTFDEPSADVLDVQDEIGREVVGAIVPRLAGGVASTARRADPVDPEAYDLYLRGRYLLLNTSVWEPAHSARVTESFRRAIARDSTWAPAWVGLAEQLGRTGERDAAREAARRAIALDSTLADAHAALAYVLAYGDWRWPDAVRAIDRARRLSPGSAAVLQRRAEILSALGRHDEAVADVERAHRLDPLSPTLDERRAVVYVAAGRWDEAIAILRDVLAVRPGRSEAHEALALAYLGKGMGEASAEEFMRTRWPLGDTVVADTISAALARGDREAMRRFVREGESSADGRIPALAMASLYAGLGQPDSAFSVLERARIALRGYPWGVGVLADPRLAPLRSDPRFAALARRWMAP